METLFICPVCANRLERTEKSYSCTNNHNFDIAKQGYVNLLQSQQTSLKHHGDDKLMVRSRREFLEKNFYSELQNKICEIVSDYAQNNCTFIDAGCGEGYYTQAIVNRLSQEHKLKLAAGVDISKVAVAYASKKCPSAHFCVASSFRLPVEDNSVNIITSIFAPDADDEFHRILSEDGILIKVYPLKKHLTELKSIIYSEVYDNDVKPNIIEGFENISNYEVITSKNIDNNNDIMNLFRMTPYYYKTSAEDQKKLLSIDNIDITLQFGISVFKKTH